MGFWRNIFGWGPKRPRVALSQTVRRAAVRARYDAAQTTDENTRHWTAADTLRLPFPDATFDAVTSGFLMRNVIDVAGALREQARVTRPGGRVVILESSPPKDNLLKPFIKIHLNHVIPTLGRLVAGESDAYRYLPDSTQAFQGPEQLAEAMRAAGLADVGYQLFMFGTIGIHVGTKRNV